jgi:hypothetical protein
MNEIREEKADVIIGLLAQLVAASTEGDPVIALANAGMRQSEIARLLGMKVNAVGMRIDRAKAGSKRQANGKG